MKKRFTTLVVILLAAQILHARSTPSGLLKLDYVRDVPFGCGGLVTYNMSDLDKSKYLLVSPMDDDTYINVDGRNVKLQLVASSKLKLEEKIGDRSWEKYAAGEIQVKVNYVVTRICDPDDEGCEVTYFRAQMIVTRGKQRRVVNGIALFGC